MTTHGRRITLALAATLISMLVGIEPATAGPPAKTTLRWKFTQGEVFRYVMDQNTVSVGQEPEGREIKETYGLIMDMTWTVKSVDASGTASITQTIDRLRTSATAPYGKFSYDSKETGGAPGPAGPLFKMLVGAEFASKMSPRGEVTDIKPSEKLLANLRGDNETPGAQGQFSEVGLKNMIAQMVLPMSEGGVDVGETWKRSLAIPAGPDGQTRQIEQTFTYKGADPASPGLEAIEFTTKLEPPKADPNVPFTFKKEAQVGRVEFDNAAGRVVKSSVDEDVEVAIAIQGKEIPQKVHTSRILTLSRDKAP